MSSLLFAPLEVRDVTVRNRIAVSPMCQYSSVDGFASDWHLVHLGARAVGGAGIVLAEATAVEPIGRISPNDLGLWKDDHVPALARITRFIVEQGAVPGIQLAHAGRKASVARPWSGGKPVALAEGGWTPVAPSAEPFAPGYAQPEALDETGIARIIGAFERAAARAREAGFRLIELHAAHGYLLNEFLSPLSNHRTDRYGGSFENRTRFVVEAVRAIRQQWPEALPLFIRISATDWAEGGWDVDQSVSLATILAREGVDLIDCSSGGNVATARIPVGPGYQSAFAERLRREARVPTGAVGMIHEPAQAEHVLRSGQADMVFLAREMLRDPYWPLRAARVLREQVPWPVQYERARLG